MNNFVFQILFDEEALEMFENKLVRDTFQALIKDGGTFNMIEALAILKPLTMLLRHLKRI